MASGVTIDTTALFASGPARIRWGPVARSVVERYFPGLDGGFANNLGRRGRDVLQAGTLFGSGGSIAAAHADVNAQIAAIEAKADGATHALADDQGHSAERVLVLGVEESGPRTVEPVSGGWRVGVDYAVRYRDLNP